MEELDTKKYAGIDLGKTSVQFSIYREGQEEMSEESFPIAKEQQEAYIETGIHLVEEYMKEKEYQWSFRFNERSDEIFVLPAKYEFCVANGADISALSFRFDLKMAVCRGFSNRAIATSFNTANINVSA